MGRYHRLIQFIARDRAIDEETKAAAIEKLLNHQSEQDGGPGSGNFGHKGRPGKRGGSGPGGGGGSGSSGGGSKESGGSTVAPAEGAKETARIRLNYVNEKGRNKGYYTISAPGREPVTVPETKKYNQNKLINEFMQKNGMSGNMNVEQENGYTFEYNPNVNPAKAAQNRKNLDAANKKQADICARRMNDYPEGSEEKKILKIWQDTLSKPLSGRPTPEADKALREKMLAGMSDKLQPYAQERYRRDLDAEPKITNDLCDIADSLGTGMYGLDFRIKKCADSGDGGNRIAEKIQESMKDDGLTYEQATDNLSDLVRYTQACTEDNLVDNYETTMKELEKRGYRAVKVKNTWDTYSIKNAYRGVNCVLVSPEGTRFELQFHTPESIVGKEVQHPQYEEQRKPETPQARKDELGRIMYENMRSMRAPKGIERIKSFKIE